LPLLVWATCFRVFQACFTPLAAIRMIMPSLDPATLNLASTCSVVVSSCGLAILAMTRPKESDSKCCFHLLHAAGITGALFLYIGLVLSSVPVVMGVAATRDATFASMIQCSLVLVCWLIDRYLITARQIPPLQSYACVIVWFGSTIIEWTGPKPHDNMTLGLAGQIAGCDGGYRSPFLIYVFVWITCLTFGAILLLLDNSEDADPAESDCADADASNLTNVTQPETKSSPHNFHMRINPVTYGLTVSMACLMFAIGAATKQMGWFVPGAILMALASACAWESLWRFKCSLASWASVSQCCSALLRLTQDHLVFRDFRWVPDDVHSTLAVHQWPGLPIFFLGITLLIATLLLFLADSSLSLWVRKSMGQQAAGMEAKVPPKQCPPLTLLQCLLLPPWLGCLLMGITKPLFETEIMTPEIFWISGKESQQAQHHIAPSSVHHVKSDQSYLDLISFMYDRHLPCSALGIAYTSVIIPPLQFIAVLVALLRPACVPLQLVDGIREWLMDQAMDRFTNPMVLMLMVAIMNFSSPGGAMFKATFTPGFWYLMWHCVFSICLAWSLQVGAEGTTVSALSGKRSLFRMESNESCQSQVLSQSDGFEWSESEDDTLLRDGGWEDGNTRSPRFLEMGCLVGGVLLLVSIHFSITYPFLNYDFRVAGVSIAAVNPTLVDLWRSMMKTNKMLGLFAVISCGFTLIIWLAVLAMRILLGSSSVGTAVVVLTRITDKLMRPCVLTHIWAMSLGIIYYMVTSRSKMVLEVCASIPALPVGLIAMGIVGGSTTFLLYVSKYLVYGKQDRESPGASLRLLPGGPCVWLVAPLACGIFWVTLLVIHAPVRPLEMTNVGDVNLELSRLVPMMNKELRNRMPESAGDCHAFWAHQVQTGHVLDPSIPSEFQQACMGHEPLVQVDKHRDGFGRMKAAATWATGLNSLELLDLRIAPSSGSQLLTISLQGRFTDLKVWMRILLDHNLFIDDYMCCNNPFHFAMEAVGSCVKGKGFDDFKLHLTHMDPIEFVHKVNLVNHDSGSLSYKVNYGSDEIVEETLKNIMSGTEGKLLMRSADGSTADGMEKMSEIVGNLIFLNTGHHCLSQAFNSTRLVLQPN